MPHDLLERQATAADLGLFESTLDGGIAHRAAIGLVVLATDQTIEHEYRLLVGGAGVACYQARLFNDADITPDTLRAIGPRIRPAVELILPGIRLDVVAFGCTSATMLLGEEAIFAEIRKARPGIACTTPVTAALAAFKALGVHRIGLLTPYSPAINAGLVRYFEGRGLTVSAHATFNRPDDREAARISLGAIETAAERLAAHPGVEAVFVSCTSLRVAERVGRDRAQDRDTFDLEQPRHGVAQPETRRRRRSPCRQPGDCSSSAHGRAGPREPEIRLARRYGLRHRSLSISPIRGPMSATISPLAPKKYPAMPAIDGVRIATAEAGIKYRNRTDLLLMAFDAGTQVAGVFTRSKCPSAPVDFCRRNLAGGSARMLVVNSGNANAFTGRKGSESTAMTGQAAADAAGCSPGEVFLASTGVIGEPLDAGRFSHLLAGMAKEARGDRWKDAASAIMTTDTYPKLATVKVKLGDADVVINGIAKGAGMIAPDMATMLSFLATDAPIDAPVLQSLLSAGVGKTFNAVTVDSDTSTSDTLLFFATGAAASRGAAASATPGIRAFPHSGEG